MSASPEDASTTWPVSFVNPSTMVTAASPHRAPRTCSPLPLVAVAPSGRPRRPSGPGSHRRWTRALSGRPWPRLYAALTPLLALTAPRRSSAYARSLPAVRLADGAGEAERLRGLVVAQQSRSDWFKAHPEVVTYLDDLAQRPENAPTKIV